MAAPSTVLEALVRAFPTEDSTWTLDGWEMRRLFPIYLKAWDTALDNGWTTVKKGGSDEAQYTCMTASLTPSGWQAISQARAELGGVKAYQQESFPTQEKPSDDN